MEKTIETIGQRPINERLLRASNSFSREVALIIIKEEQEISPEPLDIVACNLARKLAGLGSINFTAALLSSANRTPEEVKQEIFSAACQVRKESSTDKTKLIENGQVSPTFGGLLIDTILTLGHTIRSMPLESEKK